MICMRREKRALFIPESGMMKRKIKSLKVIHKTLVLSVPQNVTGGKIIFSPRIWRCFCLLRNYPLDWYPMVYNIGKIHSMTCRHYEG